MRNLLYEAPPDFVTVDGRKYGVITDFRDWLKFSDMFDDDEMDGMERVALAMNWFTDDVPPLGLLSEALQALFDFCADRDGEQPKPTDNKRVLSWAFDSAYIYAAFLSVYQIDLLTVKYLHWHVFLGLFKALPEDTPIKQRIAYRAVNLAEIKDKKEKVRIRRIQQSIRIPQKAMTAEQIGAAFG